MKKPRELSLVWYGICFQVERVTSEPPKSALLSYHTKGDNECMNIIISGLETVPIAVSNLKVRITEMTSLKTKTTVHETFLITTGFLDKRG